ncbi:MAG: adenylate kinase [Candidatus Eisenbacteria bacterium]|nr:adenylate kinase [Candidatus Eisenbacteria bacterium]
MRLILLGAPGSGKGTQGEILSRELAIPVVSTGDILRREIAAGTPLGKRVQALVGKGDLVPDDMVLELMERRLAEPDLEPGFVLDGFPRSIPQAEGLDRWLAERNQSIDLVLKIHVSKKALLQRMTGRRVCANCGAVYNLATKPPAVEGKCDVCGGVLAQRVDDDEATVRRRLNVYEAATAPLIDYYDSRKVLAIVDGEAEVGEVAEGIRRAIESASGIRGAGE